MSVYRNPKLRRSAFMEECTARISGVCNHNPETSVLAHYGQPGETGMGLKPDDTSAAILCSACHDVLDMRVRVNFVPICEIESIWFRAMRRTWKRWGEMRIQL